MRCVAKNSLGQTESVATLNLRFRQDYRSGLSKVPGGIETGLEETLDMDIEERLRIRSQNRSRDPGLSMCFYDRNRNTSVVFLILFR